MAVDPQLPQVGSIIAGKYRVERVLGVGGMGTVFAVHHLGLDERRALKLMLPRGLELPQARERFFREARAAAKLRSDHAVKIHDVAVSPEGFPYIEMELLEGSDLAAIVRRSGPIPVTHAARWIAEACEPLGEAHALGIVHRDLKPGNLFLTRRRDGSDFVKVLDFGIAKTQQQLEVDPTLTSTNASFGSPMYMSPEQMRGARFAEPRSDLWALGVVLYELTTGRRPFQAESATALALVVTGDEPAPPRALRPDLPPAVEAVILRCLAKRPDARFGSAEELAAALRAAVGEAPVRAPLPSVPQQFLAAPPSPFPLPTPPAPSTPFPGDAAVPGHVPPAGAPAAFPGIVAGSPSGAPMAPGGAPSQPTVATLTTTVGRRGNAGGVYVIGGALAAAVIAGVLLFVLLRPSGAPSSSSATSVSPAASPAGTVAAPPEDRGDSTPPAASAPAAAAPEVAPEPATEPATSASTDATATAPAALPPSTTGSSSAKAPPAGTAPSPRPAGAPSSRPRPRPSTGFGGID